MECTPEAKLKLPFVLAKTLGPVLGACNLALLWGLIWSAPARLKEAMARAGYLKGEDQTERVYGAIMDHPEGIWLARLDPEKNLGFAATGIWSGFRRKIRWGECKYIDSGRPSGQNRRYSPSPPGPLSVRESTKSSYMMLINVFDGEVVMRFALANHVVGDLALGQQGIGGNLFGIVDRWIKATISSQPGQAGRIPLRALGSPRRRLKY